jgi:hypothetical protein
VLSFDLGVERTLTLLFNPSRRGRGRARYLHQRSAVRFELPEATDCFCYDDDAGSVRAAGTFSLDSWFDYEAGRDGHTRFVSVMLRVRSDADWEVSTSDFALEFGDGRQLSAIAPIEKIAVMGIRFRAGEPRPFELLFECPADEKSQPKALHVLNPRVDFVLPSSKPQ